MPPIEAFPTINATLNATTALLLVTGRLLIGRKRIAAHRACMLAAMVTATLFLSTYLYYHAHAGTTRFPGAGWPRTLYLGILLSHTVLAVAVVPMALVTLWRGLKRMDARHRALARWTFPVWLYVSVTGVVVYWMLYRMTW
jgi:putative membrane protein